MRRLGGQGLRTRLSLALAVVAVASVTLATMLVNQGLTSRVTEFARDRLQTSARHSAVLAAGYYLRSGGWSRRDVRDLVHLAEMNGFRLAIYDANGRLLPASRRASRGGERARAAVEIGDEHIGAVVVEPMSGQVLTGEDRKLRGRLNRLHALAGALAIGVGLVAAVLIAAPLTRPIRRVTEVARRIEQGDLESRVEPSGGAEIEQLGHALNRLAETLQREEEIRREAAADIAHELRTPLAGIASRIEAAQDSVLADEQQNLEAMHAEAQRLTQLVEDLGRLAEAQQPGLLIEKTPFDLAELAGRRAASYADFFRAKNIDLKQRLTPVQVSGDSHRIAQILDNLLANALRFTEDGGEVTLRVALSAEGEAVIEVTDTGIGIAKDDLRHVFERFWRGDKSRSRATGGAGIGLAIVHELVRAHDGRIEVESEPGRGSRFRVTLPLG